MTEEQDICPTCGHSMAKSLYDKHVDICKRMSIKRTDTIETPSGPVEVTRSLENA